LKKEQDEEDRPDYDWGPLLREFDGESFIGCVPLGWRLSFGLLKFVWVRVEWICIWPESQETGSSICSLSRYLEASDFS